MKNQEAAAYSKEPSYKCSNSMRSRWSNRFSHMLDSLAIAQLQSELFSIELLFSASLVRSDKTLSTRILFLHDDRNSHTRHLIGLNPNPRTTYVSERIGRPLEKSWWTRPVGHFKLDVRHIISSFSGRAEKSV